jgi:hypothetical protein
MTLIEMLLEIVITQLHNNEAARAYIESLSPLRKDLNYVFMTCCANTSNCAQFIVDVVWTDAVLLSHDLTGV